MSLELCIDPWNAPSHYSRLSSKFQLHSAPSVCPRLDSLARVPASHRFATLGLLSPDGRVRLPGFNERLGPAGKLVRTALVAVGRMAAKEPS